MQGEVIWDFLGWTNHPLYSTFETELFFQAVFPKFYGCSFSTFFKIANKIG
jgi:hypothetical protein